MPRPFRHVKNSFTKGLGAPGSVESFLVVGGSIVKITSASGPDPLSWIGIDWNDLEWTWTGSELELYNSPGLLAEPTLPDCHLTFTWLGAGPELDKKKIACDFAGCGLHFHTCFGCSRIVEIWKLDNSRAASSWAYTLQAHFWSSASIHIIMCVRACVRSSLCKVFTQSDDTLTQSDDTLTHSSLVRILSWPASRCSPHSGSGGLAGWSLSK